jgi:hypothetical protein
LRDMVGIPCWVEAAFCAATAEAPHKRWSRRGGIPGELLALPAGGPVTLCSQKKFSPFRTIFPPAWGRGPWTMQTETGSQGRRHEVHSFGRLFGRHTMRFLSGKAVFSWAFVSGDCVAATDGFLP